MSKLEKAQNPYVDLFDAATKGDTNRIVEAQRAGATIIDQQDNQGRTAFYCAAAANQPESVEKLFLYHAKANIPCNSEAQLKASPIHWAAYHGNIDMMGKMFTWGSVDIETTDMLQQTPLHWAALKGHKDAVNFLIQSKANVNAQSQDGVTPLSICIDKKDLVLSVMLIAAGATIDKISKSQLNETLLQACHDNSLKAVARLITSGAEINAKSDEILSTPLHYAATHKSAKVMRVLKQAGNSMQVDAKDADGNTPLHHAAYHGNVECTRILLEMGADPKAVNKQGTTPGDFAESRGKTDVSTLFAEKIAAESVTSASPSPVPAVADAASAQKSESQGYGLPG